MKPSLSERFDAQTHLFCSVPTTRPLEPSRMTVHVVGWKGAPYPGAGVDARAYVDQVRVKVRRTTEHVRWICAEHGTSVNHPGCAHAQAFAAEAPADHQESYIP